MTKYWVDGNGKLNMENVRGRSSLCCPFDNRSGDVEECGDWCPHFNEVGNDVRISCSGVIISFRVSKQTFNRIGRKIE